MAKLRDPQDLIGQRYGRLVVMQVRRGKTHLVARVACDCGTEKDVRIDHLRREKDPIRGCGCIRIKSNRERLTTHGATGTAVHRIWRNMINRCENPRVASYARYGARGIKVCEKWRRSFAAFLFDVGPRPSKVHSIDRINSNGNYEPGNVRWATAVEQAQNRRSNNRLTLNGETMCVAAWARRTGISPNCLISRKEMGWTDERTLTTPSKGAPRVAKKQPPVRARGINRSRQGELFGG